MKTVVLDFLNSVDIFWVTGLVVALSFFLAFIWARITINWVRWSLVLISPFALSGAVYWTPVWLGANVSEYSAWAGAVVLMCGLPSLLVSSIVVFLIRRHHRNQHL